MKLLITTDFSANSKGAIRFAQALASQSNEIETTFYHSVHFIKQNLWSDIFFETYQKEEIERLKDELKKFVHSTVGTDKFPNSKFVVEIAISTEKDIIHYAEKNKIDFICIATKGAGVLRKIMGTHTSYIANNSNIPVLVIPSHYRPKAINKLTYLSDFENTKKEIDKVSKFSNVIKCGVDVLHYSSLILDKNKFERNKALFNTEEYKGFKLNIVENKLEKPLLESIYQFINKNKPTLLVMFTNRNKSFLDTLFLPSNSAELTYSTKVPVLIFPK